MIVPKISIYCGRFIAMYANNFADMHGFVVLLIASFFFAANGTPAGRIIGGHDAADGQYPYQVAIKLNGRLHCGGSIINKRYILTAAHCLSVRVSDIQISVGTNYLNKGGESYMAEKLIPNDEFDYYRAINDIGLIRVAKDIQFNDKVQPIPLSAKDTSASDYSAKLTGWGRLQNGGIIPNSLQEIDLQVISLQQCKSSWDVIASQICTYTKHGEGSCNGDSGGPLVSGGVQIGVVSYGVPCGVGRPDVFTRVSSFRDWINQHSSDVN